MLRLIILSIAVFAVSCGVNSSSNLQDDSESASEANVNETDQDDDETKELREEIRKKLLETAGTGMNNVTFYYGRQHTIIFYEELNKIFESKIDRNLAKSSKQTTLSIHRRPYLILHTNSTEFRRLASMYYHYAEDLDSGKESADEIPDFVVEIVKAPIWKKLAKTMQHFRVEDTTYTRDYPYLQEHKVFSSQMAQASERIRRHLKEK